jgi:hypothetical protein
LELRTHGLAVSFMFTSPGVEGWMWCGVQMDVPGFHGEYDFQLERLNLELFRSQLAHATEPTNWPCQAQFSSTDPGVDLVLQVARSGQVVGEYRFCNYNGGGATLSGSFALDQTYLPPLLAQVERSLAELAEPCDAPDPAGM